MVVELCTYFTSEEANSDFRKILLLCTETIAHDKWLQLWILIRQMVQQSRWWHFVTKIPNMYQLMWKHCLHKHLNTENLLFQNSRFSVFKCLFKCLPSIWKRAWHAWGYKMSAVQSVWPRTIYSTMLKRDGRPLFLYHGHPRSLEISETSVCICIFTRWKVIITYKLKYTKIILNNLLPSATHMWWFRSPRYRIIRIASGECGSSRVTINKISSLQRMPRDKIICQCFLRIQIDIYQEN